MKIGIVTRSMPAEFTNQQAAETMAAMGFTSTELCFTQSDSSYWCYNGRTDLSDLTPQRVREIVDIYRNKGIQVTALGVFTNLIEHDDQLRRQNLDRMIRFMDYAQFADVPYVSSECGFDPQCRGVQVSRYESDVALLADSLTTLCAAAEERDVSLALECCVIDVIPSAKRARDLIRQVGSDRLKVLLDPANYIANSDEEDMFKYLAPHIAYFHGKDRMVNDTYGRLVGDGEINWPLFLALRDRYAPDAPFILEYCNKDNAQETKERVERFYEQSKSVTLPGR